MNRMVSPGAWGISVILAWLLVLAIIAVLCVLSYWLLTGSARRTRGARGMRGAGEDEGPLGSLERRYAAGQIDDAEFERRRETILAGRDRAA
ncbi:MAG: SHOCT domain-containing protein [Solirubrobacteraceae bacterium]